MDAFKTLHSVAAVIPQADIDTDMILPAQFLLRIDREGLGAFAFHGVRQDPDNPFILDRAPFDKAQIIIGGERMGIGSSREQAVWSLVDFGIRCVIAPSFGEIFHANCFKNGVLALTLEGDTYAAVKAAGERGDPLTVDLENNRLTSDNTHIPIGIDSHQRDALLLGRDETGAILEDDAADIAAFETEQTKRAPWLSLSDDQLSTYFSHLDKA